MTKYRHAERSTSASVWFKTLDGGGKVLKDYPSAPCFAQITYKPGQYGVGYGMHKDTKTIHVYRSKSAMPYNVPEIKRWIDDLNELGFRCRFADDGVVGDVKKQESFIQSTINKKLQEFAIKVIRAGHPAPADPNEFYNFYIDLKDYKDKSHLFSTLSLIRMLSESYYDTVPETYFNMMDKDPTLDKFQALQDAHKKCNTSGGHCVTYNGNGDNVSHKELMKRFDKHGDDLWEGTLRINECWGGKSRNRY